MTPMHYALRYIVAAAALLFLNTCQAVSQEKIELKNAKELSGRIVEGQNVREAKGDVEFAQGNVKVYCNSAVQYINSNRVELSGNVKIIQDTLSLFTDKAVYYGDEKRAVCNGKVILKDPNATLSSDNGVYTFSDAKAYFKGDVIIVNPGYRIISDELIYFRNTEESFATGNVAVVTDSSTVTADKIDFFSREGRTYARGNVRITGDSTVIDADTAISYSHDRRSLAYGNVRIVNPGNNTVITGDRLENYGSEKITKLFGNSYLVQIENGRDTLFISGDTMTAFREIPEKYVVFGNVEIIRGNFASKCGEAVYYKDSEKISLDILPVVWQDGLQLTADSVFAELPGKKLQKIFARRNNDSKNSVTSFAVSRNSDTKFSERFDQISGSYIAVSFADDKITGIDVDGNARSIYYMYDQGYANGFNRIEGDEIRITFDAEEKVAKIKVISNPKGEYVPEQLIGNFEQTLPGFLIREDKPARKQEQNF